MLRQDACAPLLKPRDHPAVPESQDPLFDGDHSLLEVSLESLFSLLTGAAQEPAKKRLSRWLPWAHERRATFMHSQRS